MGHTLTIAEAKARPLEDLLREIAEGGEAVRIELEQGAAVQIAPAPAVSRHLKPLERLPGYVPDGWKDAIYEPKSGPR